MPTMWLTALLCLLSACAMSAPTTAPFSLVLSPASASCGTRSESQGSAGSKQSHVVKRTNGGGDGWSSNTFEPSNNTGLDIGPDFDLDTEMWDPSASFQNSTSIEHDFLQNTGQNWPVWQPYTLTRLVWTTTFDRYSMPTYNYLGLGRAAYIYVHHIYTQLRAGQLDVDAVPTQDDFLTLSCNVPGDASLYTIHFSTVTNQLTWLGVITFFLHLAQWVKQWETAGTVPQTRFYLYKEGVNGLVAEGHYLVSSPIGSSQAYQSNGLTAYE